MPRVHTAGFLWALLGVLAEASGAPAVGRQVIMDHISLDNPPQVLEVTNQRVVEMVYSCSLSNKRHGGQVRIKSLDALPEGELPPQVVPSGPEAVTEATESQASEAPTETPTEIPTLPPVQLQPLPETEASAGHLADPGTLAAVPDDEDDPQHSAALETRGLPAGVEQQPLTQVFYGWRPERAARHAAPAATTATALLEALPDWVVAGDEAPHTLATH